ncbi:MAG: DNA-directed RNA polymerase subunit omega [bacterium]|nr:DNA-directed RNA polymerase subunit omega [bacterium]MDT8396822.1 DNA-directed RNA polymerase subunit omega [bacterium]
MKLNTMEMALKRYPNRFELTMMAVARAREINDGDKPIVQTEELVKPVVAALEEIAGGKIVPASQEDMIKIRDARRIVRERTLMEAAKEMAEDDDMDEAYGAASAEDPDK